jgi:hypothetical protein
MDPRTPSSPSLDTALLCPLSVGVVAWSAPEPTLTVVVKATFTLPEDGAARLADRQEPLFLDEQGALGEPGDLDRASDFAPLKARADVLVTGFAYATSPMHVLSAGFAVDKLRKRFYAVAAEPSAQTPLYPRYLRASPGPEGAPVQVGARAVWASGSPAATLVSREGVPTGAFSRGFDYGLFNVAPPDQQLGLLSPTARLVLEGLVPGGDRRMVPLPGARPRVFCIPSDGSGGARGADETPLRCDTLWIDAGRERCTLTFRGVLAPLANDATPILVVAMDFGSERQSWQSLRAELDRAEWIRAATPESTREALALRAAPPVRPIVRRPQPTLDLGALNVAIAPTAISSGRTQEIDARAVQAALPFKGEAAPRPLMVLGGFKGALASFQHARTAPVEQAPSPPVEQAPPAFMQSEDTSPPPSVTRIGLTIPFAAEAPPAALPFQPASAVPAAPSPPMLRFPTPEESRAALPFAPLGRFPAPSEVVLARAPEQPLAPAPRAEPEPERGASDRIPLDRYAAIKAATWAGRSLEGVLREQGVDEIRWYSNERLLAAALADEAAQGKSALSQELRRALKRAQAPATSSEGALPPPEPAKRRARKERAPAGARRVPAKSRAAGAQ